MCNEETMKEIDHKVEKFGQRLLTFILVLRAVHKLRGKYQVWIPADYSERIATKEVYQQNHGYKSLVRG